jgi:hypothetical protein
MSRRFSVGPALVVTVIALAVALVAAAAWRSQPQAGPPQLSLASKHLRLTQTNANKALIKMRNAKPGQVAKGKTRVTITGFRAAVKVRVKNPRDIPGPNGGRLIASRHLWIDVRCAGSPCPHNRVAYRGPLASMGTRSLGTWRPGAHRTYALRVWLLRGGMPRTRTTGDNRYQQSAAKFGLVWTATAG